RPARPRRRRQPPARAPGGRRDRHRAALSRPRGGGPARLPQHRADPVQRARRERALPGERGARTLQRRAALNLGGDEGRGVDGALILDDGGAARTLTLPSPGGRGFHLDSGVGGGLVRLVLVLVLVFRGLAGLAEALRRGAEEFVAADEVALVAGQLALQLEGV